MMNAGEGLAYLLRFIDNLPDNTLDGSLHGGNRMGQHADFIVFCQQSCRHLMREISRRHNIQMLCGFLDRLG
ncbi:hypothetical protein D3C72_2478140 [compost metagenome]